MPELGRLQRGDLAWIHDRGAVFEVADPAVEQPRADALEISPTGPMPGTRCVAPGGDVGAREAALLAQDGLRPESFRIQGLGTFQGVRRPFRAPVDDVEVRDATETAGDEPALRLRFRLPPGSYATAVLKEVMG